MVGGAGGGFTNDDDDNDVMVPCPVNGSGVSESVSIDSREISPFARPGFNTDSGVVIIADTDAPLLL